MIGSSICQMPPVGTDQGWAEMGKMNPSDILRIWKDTGQLIYQDNPDFKVQHNYKNNKQLLLI